MSGIWGDFQVRFRKEMGISRDSGRILRVVGSTWPNLNVYMYIRLGETPVSKEIASFLTGVHQQHNPPKMTLKRHPGTQNGTGNLSMTQPVLARSKNKNIFSRSAGGIWGQEGRRRGRPPPPNGRAGRQRPGRRGAPPVRHVSFFALKWPHGRFRSCNL